MIMIVLVIYMVNSTSLPQSQYLHGKYMLPRYLTFDLRWQTTPAGPCSALCGGGYQILRRLCVRRFGWGRNDIQIVKPQHCDHMEQPERKIVCNTHACPPSWRVGQWSKVGQSSHTDIYCKPQSIRVHTLTFTVNPQVHQSSHTHIYCKPQSFRVHTLTYTVKLKSICDTKGTTVPWQNLWTLYTSIFATPNDSNIVRPQAP
jgi:hypothetical protein